ncbi:MAG: cyclic pyranopterin monophosphate synthase MoaC [Opitutales bacterium]
MPDFSHIDASGQPAMVDVGDKAVTRREAVAEAQVHLGAEVLKQLQGGEIHSAKGPVFATAIVAGTQAAKQTSLLIPLCHHIALEKARIEIEPVDPERVRIRASMRATHKTGLEMEALTAVSIAALTLHDMCKALNPAIVIEQVRLLEKRGGKSDYTAPEKTAPLNTSAE